MLYWSLQIFKLLLFVFGFVFATSFLVPKAIKYFSLWRLNNDYKKLQISVTFGVGGIFLLVYLLVNLILNK